MSLKICSPPRRVDKVDNLESHFPQPLFVRSGLNSFIVQIETGSPGMTVAVSVDGKIVWTEGFGYSDLENRVKCTPESVFRIASISKAITMATVAKLIERGDLDIDKPVQYYVPECRNHDPAATLPFRRNSSFFERIFIFFLHLCCYLGSKFLYTTHGWTLISAVVEKAAKMPFEEYLRQTLDELGLENTYLEEHQPLIKNRGRYINTLMFLKKKNLTQTTLKESKENVEDDDKLSGFLKPDTMKMMWTPYVIPEAKWEGIVNAGYGMGWSVCRNKHEHAFCKDQKFYACHTGGAIGASSVLMVVPRESALHTNEKNKDSENKTDGIISKSNTAQDLQEASLFNSKRPKGVVVAIIANMTSVGLNKTAYDIARIFECVGYKM
ncbi:serine beta-lactamase-like protein LACTB, mitochondrial [Ruditapes philippinarum]|uniref:serine beta-lactamase-like protein LACTB, mitochondrial n=1 Tax=Ruditapes philippinarum TaxID=129788 RepID=UPI00295AA73B|nr:serine beta-lactamase-like protein LACTB, mitochondrial [Ruditapes philippinarum]